MPSTHCTTFMIQYFILLKMTVYYDNAATLLLSIAPPQLLAELKRKRLSLKIMLAPAPPSAPATVALLWLNRQLLMVALQWFKFIAPPEFFASFEVNVVRRTSIVPWKSYRAPPWWALLLKKWIPFLTDPPVMLVLHWNRAIAPPHEVHKNCFWTMMLQFLVNSAPPADRFLSWQVSPFPINEESCILTLQYCSAKTAPPNSAQLFSNLLPLISMLLLHK